MMAEKRQDNKKALFISVRMFTSTIIQKRRVVMQYNIGFLFIKMNIQNCMHNVAVCAFSFLCNFFFAKRFVQFLFPSFTSLIFL